MRNGIASLALVAGLLAVASCGAGGDGKGATEGGDASTLASTTAAAPENCDAPADGLALGGAVSSQVQATNQPYPANAVYYCVASPEGAQSLTIEMSGLTADLDLYVGFGSITTIQGEQVSQGETFTWKSNAFGTVNETVTIPNPQAGLYYIEIASYEGQASPYTLSAR
jgi:hypothetical protein